MGCGVLSETESDYVEKFAPELAFSKNERYLPCELFLAGRDIRGNKKSYEKLSVLIMKNREPVLGLFVGIDRLVSECYFFFQCMINSRSEQSSWSSASQSEI